MKFANGGVNPSGASGAAAEVTWSVPATGSTDLTPEQARILADDLETIAAEGETWHDTMELLLNGKSPRVVAAELREEADEAERAMDLWQEKFGRGA